MTQKPTVLSEAEFNQQLSQYFSHNQPYIADDGFAARVLAKLPAKRGLAEPLRWAILIIPAMVFTLLIQAYFPLLLVLDAGIKGLTHLLSQASVLHVGLVSLILALACALWLFKEAQSD